MSISSSRTWVIREAGADDLPTLSELSQAVFGHSRDETYLYWKFFANPEGAPLLVVADNGGRLVGQYALWPVQLQLGQEVLLGAQSLDTMTHPDYRGQGMFVALAGACMELAAARGIDVLYGFPNVNSYPGFIRRLNWDHTGDVRTWTRPLRAEAIRRIPPVLSPVAAAVLRAWPKGRIRNYNVSATKPERDEIARLLALRKSMKEVCQVNRSAAWYDWRFAAEFQNGYAWVSVKRGERLAAYAVWGVDRTTGAAILSEVVGEDIEATEAVISAAARHAQKQNCSLIGTVAGRHDVLPALRRCGFRATGNIPFIVRSLTTRILDGNIHEHRQWQLFGADLDVY